MRSSDAFQGFGSLDLCMLLLSGYSSS